ncbi:MAG: Ig-like domain-containing protein [Lachnospiraceae bacterium]|nr:Ig-like domain-containing protein [Lachnospiraceae bacterium]
MLNTMKTRLMCMLTAASVAMGTIAFPVQVWADEDDDYGWVDDLEDLTPEERRFIEDLGDEDGDGDIDERDVIAAAVTAAVIDDMAREAERQQREEAERRRKADEEANRNRRVSGVAVSTTYVKLTPGQTYQVYAYVKPDSAENKGYWFTSNNPSVATVDGSGMIHAVNAGNAVVTVTTSEGGYRASVNVDVNYAPAAAAQTVAQDANWTAIATNMILAAAPGSVVNLVAPKAMSFDAGMINALKMRPDVGVLIAYPYNGHAYALAVPAGYNLASKMDATGKVSFIKLAAVNDGKVITAMTK